MDINSQIKVVVQVGLCAIGFDRPELAVDIDAKPSNSVADWLQRRGRVSRAYPAPQGDRSYQEYLIDRAKAELAAKRNPLIVSPTGSGKSFIACRIAQRAYAKGCSIGFLTVRRALVDDISSRLARFGVPHGVVMADRKDNEHRTKVASIHTLAARDMTLDVDCLFLDEAHCYLSNEFGAVIARHSHIPRVLLTATPWTASGAGLGRIADSMILGPSIQDLTDQGFLVPFRIFTRSIPDVSKLDINSSGEYNEPQLEQVMSSAAIMGDIVKEWLYRAEGRPTIVHAVNISHADKIVAKFRKAGVHAVRIDASTPDHERNRVFDNMCAGAPPKHEALLIDLAGNVAERFGHPQDDREWQLEDRGNPKEPHAAVLSIRRCTKCWLTYKSSASKCPECGNAYVPTVREVREKKAALTEYKREQKEKAIDRWRDKCDADAKHKKLVELIETGVQKKWKPAAALARYRAIFKEDVPPEWRGEVFRRARTS